MPASSTVPEVLTRYSASTLTRGVSHEQLVSYLWLKNMRSKSRVPMEWRAVGTMLQMLKLVTRADEGMDDGSSMTLWEGHWSEGEQEDMHYTDTLELNLSLSTSNLNLALLGHPGHTNHVQYIYSSKETASLLSTSTQQLHTLHPRLAWG